MSNKYDLVLSTLGHTWILDLDGTVVIHNGYKDQGFDSFIPKAREFLLALPKEDYIIFITSRTEEFRASTEAFLQSNGIRYNAILFDAPYGERILVNDNKPAGLQMAFACPIERNKFDIKVTIDQTL